MTIFHVIKFHRNSLKEVDFDNLPDTIRNQWLMTHDFHTLDHEELLITLKQLLLEYDPNDNL